MQPRSKSGISQAAEKSLVGVKSAASSARFLAPWRGRRQGRVGPYITQTRIRLHRAKPVGTVT